MTRPIDTYLDLPDDVGEYLGLLLKAEDWALHGVADERAKHDAIRAQSEAVEATVSELTAT